MIRPAALALRGTPPVFEIGADLGRNGERRSLDGFASIGVAPAMNGTLTAATVLPEGAVTGARRHRRSVCTRPCLPPNPVA